MNKFQFLILIILLGILMGCTSEINYNKQTKSEAVNSEVNEVEQKVIINELYQKFHSIDLNKIDCNNSSFLDIDLIDFSFSPFNSEHSSYAKPTKWYPSLKKGQISWLSGKAKNVGCTEIDLAYFSIIVFEDTIIYSSPILEFDSSFDYDKYLPQQEKSVFFSPVASEYTADSFKISKAGDYTVFIILKNTNTNNIVGIEKYVVNTTDWI